MPGSSCVLSQVRRNSLNIDAQLKLPQYIRLADKANHSIEQPAPIQYIDCIRSVITHSHTDL